MCLSAELPGSASAHVREHTSSRLTVELVHTFPIEPEFEQNALWLLILTSRGLLRSLLSS